MGNSELTWREFEQLVAHIEEQLAPEGAIVKSPDKIPDKVTGSLREVDASIRFNVGTTPILITIECRNRGKVQDDTWIEQLSKKKEKIGASATIAVSKNGFSEPAKKSAAHYNIELRTLKEINNSSSLDWIEGIELKATFLSWEFVSLKLSLESDSKNIQIDPAVNERIATLGHDAWIGSNEETGEKLILGDIASQFIREGKFPKAPRIIAQGIVMPQSPMYIPTNEGRTKIQNITIEVKIISIEQPIPAIKAFEYASNTEALVQSADINFPFSGGMLKYRLVNKPQ